MIYFTRVVVVAKGAAKARRCEKDIAAPWRSFEKKCQYTEKHIQRNKWRNKVREMGVLLRQ